MMSFVEENKLISGRAPRRRSFPLVQKLEHFSVDLVRVREELARLSEGHDWEDMSHGSPLVEDLIFGRERLTKAFQDSEGNYSHYKQILLTEFNEERALKKQEQACTDSGYGSEVKKLDPRLDESMYNAFRSFMVRAPYLKEILGKFQNELMRARFARVAPSSSIKPHIDYDIPYGTRYHLAIETNDQCVIGLRRSPLDEFEEFHIPSDGHFYFVNVGFEHFAKNSGLEHRTHLVVSVNGHKDILDYRQNS